MTRALWLALLVVVLGSGVRADVIMDRNSNVSIECIGAAAEELSLCRDLLGKYLPRVLGKDSLAGEGPAVTFVLESKAVTAAQLTAADIRSLGDLDGFTVAIQGAPAPTVRISGATVTGVGMGVMDLLERHAGITWLFPGDLGIVAPVREKLVLPEGEMTSRPAVVSRLYGGIQGIVNLKLRQTLAKPGRPLAGDRHFWEADDAIKSLRPHALLQTSHNMINIFPARETTEKRPHLMPMLEDGTRLKHSEQELADRKRSQHWHPCYTHPESAEIAIAAARQAFSKGALIYSLGINDGRRTQCQCPECRKVGWPESYYQFVEKVAAAVKDQYPPRMLGVLVYGDVRHPTKPLKLPENVYANVATGRFSEWAPRAQHLGRYNYFYGDGFDIPNLPLKAMALDGRRIREYGVKGYYAEVRPVWAFDAPKLFIHSRILWDPQADVEALLDRYCAAAFGKGGPAMGRFYRQWSPMWDYLADNAGAEMPYLADLGVWRNSQAQFSLVTDADYTAAAASIAEARTLAGPGPEQLRLEMVAAHFDYSRALFDLTRITQNVFSHGEGLDPATIAATLFAKTQEAERLEKLIAAHPEWSLCSKDSERGGGWTIDKEIRSAGITALFRLRESPGWNASRAEALPEALAPYAAPIAASVPCGVKVQSKGTYYATAPNYLPMKNAKTPGGFRIESVPEPAAAHDDAEGGEAGAAPMKQWALTDMAYGKGTGRLLIDVRVEGEGREGVLSVNLSNPWRAIETDGLPVSTSMVFDQRGGTQERRIVVEPVALGAANWQNAKFLRVSAVWTPRAGESSCSATVSATAIQLETPQEKK